MLGLQFAGTVADDDDRLQRAASQDVLEDAPENQLTNLISFAGLMALFMLNFHHIVFRALVDSYTALPMGGFNPQSALITLTDTLAQTFSIMLRLASPFIIYGVLFNVAVGLINKLAPQMPIYFISLPVHHRGRPVPALLRYFLAAGDFRQRLRAGVRRTLRNDHDEADPTSSSAWCTVQRHLEQMAEMDLALTTQQRQEVTDDHGRGRRRHQPRSILSTAISPDIYAAQIGKLRHKDKHAGRRVQPRCTKCASCANARRGDRLEEQDGDAQRQEASADKAVYDLIDSQSLGDGPDRRAGFEKFPIRQRASHPGRDALLGRIVWFPASRRRRSWGCISRDSASP